MAWQHVLATQLLVALMARLAGGAGPPAPALHAVALWLQRGGLAKAGQAVG